MSLSDPNNQKGLFLALSSSAFIGSSFIVKKKGLIRARSSGQGAATGGFAYLHEPMWWIGMVTMILGEIANFTAYAFAPAILVTPLGGLSVIVSAVLAAVMLDEKLELIGKLGCGLCVLGSTIIVLNCPSEREISSVDEITMMMKTNLTFQLYVLLVGSGVVVLIYDYAPRMGKTNVFVYVAVCSLVGSISVIGVKGLSIGLKLTFSGNNQLTTGSFWFFVILVTGSVVTQMNYLNKALDTFNTAVVSPIYYVLFTTATILASGILFNGWGNAGAEYPAPQVVAASAPHKGGQAALGEREYGAGQFISAICGFLTIVCGVALLHLSRNSVSGGGRAANLDRALLAMWEEDPVEGLMTTQTSETLVISPEMPSRRLSKSPAWGEGVRGANQNHHDE
mmetsp:Transcript_31331/g.82112  ORF Transcript_31331/g.82112 Transcript_31331/m.82112 type:complete len:395 (+) Transcript_31331:24-1208(+)